MDHRLPLYLRVFENLKEKIEDKEFEEGKLLPSERMLQDMFGASRITIRKALEMLANQGYIFPKQGVGTIVKNNKTVQKLNYVSSLSETLEAKGFKVSIKNINIESINAPKYIADYFDDLSEGKLFKIYRERFLDDKPFSYSINYFLPGFMPGIEPKDLLEKSLYKILYDRYKIEIESADEYIGAKSASENDSEILKVEVGSPLLTSKRISYISNKVFEVVQTRIIPGHYEYLVHMVGRKG